MIKAIVFDCFGVLVSLDGRQRNQPLLTYIRDDLRPHFKIALLSNAGSGAMQRYLPDDLGLFSAVVVSGDTKYMKPDREIFELTARQLGVQLDEMLFVDDIERYTSAASSFGIPSLQYHGLAELKQQLQILLQ